MAVLVIAEHDNKTLKRATLQAVDAAARLGEVHLLVLGSGVDAVAQAAAKVAGVAQVKVVDDAALAEPLAEVVTAQVVPLAKDYSHVVAAATAHGKDFMPRVAALLDVAQISEVTGIDSADTFRRPIYAGNAIATVQSSDPIKVLTVRGTSFDEAAAEGGSAAIEKVAAVAVDGQPALVGREQASSDRPELTAAQVVVAGVPGRAGAAGRPAGCRPGGLACGGGRRLCAQRLAGGADRQDRCAAALHRGRHLGCHPAPGRHEGQPHHRGHQQG